MYAIRSYYVQYLTIVRMQRYGLIVKTETARCRLHTAAALSRHTGQDDVDEALRTQVLEQLRRSNAAARWQAWVEGQAGAEAQESERHLWGDTLPVGRVLE